MSTELRPSVEPGLEPGTATGPARRFASRHAELLTYVASAVVSALATFLSLDLWRADLRVPFWYVGDAVAVAAHFKTVLETGWYEYQPLLGAPFGQTYHDFPTADNLNFAAAHVLGWFTDDFAVAMNLYFLAGFVLAALAGVWFLRECGVSRVLTVTLSVLLAIAPYHFVRAETHLWLASYFTLPLALVVVLRVLRGEASWGVRPGRGRVLGLLTGRGAVTVVALGLLGTASSYYAVFVAILLAVAGGAALLRDRDWRRFAGAAGAGVLLVAVVVANMLPDILYTRTHGQNSAGLVRDPGEVEVYALKLAQLLLPIPGHRVDFLAKVRHHYDSSYPLVSELPSLGVTAAFGLVCVLFVTLYRLAGRSVRTASEVPDVVAAERTRTIEHLALLTMVAFLCSTVGGFATFLSFLTSSLRGWNRMSIVIGTLCLAVTGLVVQALLARIARWRGWSARTAGTATLVVAVGVLGVGYLDQVTPGAVPYYDASAASYAADEAWVDQVEAELPEAAMVFQLPYVGFPETDPVNGVGYPDQLRPYLHSAHLRWSGAGIKGRSTSDWPRVVADRTPDVMVTELAAVGFAGITVDRQAYGVKEAGSVERGLTGAAGPPVAQSADGRFALYSLTDEIDRLADRNPSRDVRALAESVVAPVLTYPGDEVTSVPGTTGRTDWRLPAGSEGVILDNGRPGSVRVRLEATVTAPLDADGRLVLRVAGDTVDVRLTGGVGTVGATVDVPSGRSVLDVIETESDVTLTSLELRETGLPQLVP